MINSNRIGLLLAGLLAMAACGGDDGGSVAIDDLADALADAQCARLVRCNTYVSQAACLAEAQLDVTELKHSIEAGRVSYDGAKVAACLDAFGAAPCDASTEAARVTPAACDEGVKGTVADGGTCYTNTECVSESCNQPDCGMACCEGVCDPTVGDAAIGQSCANARCVDGAFCNGSDVCTALLAAGAACQSDGQCAYGLACGNSVCAPAANRGEACLDGDCTDIGDRCDGTSCVARSTAGGACRMGFDGLFDCQRPLVCNGTSLKCEEPPTAGQACQFFCASGLFCNDQDTCEAPRANGAACNSNTECTSNFCDDTLANPVCAVEPVCG